MEYIDGVSLEKLLRKGPLPVAPAVSLMIPVAEAVHYAHGKRVIHRDLKPANVMVDRLQRPVVMDFGIAKVLGKPATVTQDHVVVGTPAYMAPEQAGDNRSLTGPAMDVYALGAILYTVLTGRPPYEGETPLQVVLKVVAQEPPEPVRSLRPEVSPALEQVIMQCLGKHPSDRFESAHALADEVRRLRAGGLLV